MSWLIYSRNETFFKQSFTDLCNTHPKYLNSKTYFSHVTITLLLFSLINRPLLLHTSTKCPTITFRSFSVSYHKIRLSAYKRPGNFLSLHSENLIPILPIPIFTSFVTASMYMLKSQGNMIHLCLMPLSVLKHSLLLPFTLTQTRLFVHIPSFLKPFKSLPPTSYILITYHTNSC